MSWKNNDIGDYTYYWNLRVGDINATTVFKTKEINIEITSCVTEWTYVDLKGIRDRLVYAEDLYPV